MKRLHLAALLTLVGLSGCGSEEDRIALVPVSGTVTLNGKPMAGAKVSFMPDASNKAQTPGIDETGPEGNFKIMFKHRSGLSPGKYKVIITPAIDISGAGKVPEAFKDDPYMAQLSLGVVGPGSEKKKLDYSNTEHEVEVGDKAEVFEFDVKGTAKGSSAAAAPKSS